VGEQFDVLRLVVFRVVLDADQDREWPRADLLKQAGKLGGEQVHDAQCPLWMDAGQDDEITPAVGSGQSAEVGEVRRRHWVGV
jgi:hypothetical protein